MNMRKFRDNFPAGKKIPKHLIQLFYYQKGKLCNIKARKYSGHFRLHGEFWGTPFTIPEIINYFIPFGSDADGSVYAFWMYKDFPLEHAPIVFLGAAWCGNTILANSLNEFLALLTLGVDHLGYAVHFPSEWLNHISNDAETVKFRKWIKFKLGISVPSNPNNILEGARKSHPDFGEWIKRKTSLSPEKNIKPPWE